MGGGWLPKRNTFGNLEGAVRRGRGGKEKEWTDCVQSDIQAFGITGDWEAMALKAERWVERSRRVVGGSWPRGGKKRKTRPDIARRKERHRQEKREATRLGKLLSHTEAYNFAKRHPLA